PSYELVLEATTPLSVQWNSLWLGMEVEPLHIYGSFFLRLTNVVYVDYIEFRVGENNESDPVDFLYWDLMLNDSSAPFEWHFSTLDFPVGLLSISIIAYNTSGYGTHYVGGVLSLYFEHQDRSFEQVLISSLSIALVGISVFVAIIVGCVFYRRRPEESSHSRFERDVFYG
ncbi:MAG: hypothetical protein RTU30_11380, partial [Candidatus Thorarchaeota archaeon]